MCAQYIDTCRLVRLQQKVISEIMWSSASAIHSAGCLGGPYKAKYNVVLYDDVVPHLLIYLPSQRGGLRAEEATSVCIEGQHTPAQISHSFGESSASS